MDRLPITPSLNAQDARVPLLACLGLTYDYCYGYAPARHPYLSYEILTVAANGRTATCYKYCHRWPSPSKSPIRSVAI